MAEHTRLVRPSPLMRAMLDVAPDFLATAPDLSGSIWSEFGIHIPYTFVITGRCGSTWVTNLLGSCGASNEPHEFFSEDGFPYWAESMKAKDIRSYVAGLVNTYNRNGVFGFQITPMRLAWLHQILDDGPFLMPNRCAWVDLRRLNIVAQAFSFRRARVSGVWHRYTNGEAPAYAAPLPATPDRDVWDEIIRILAQERAIDQFYTAYRLTPLRHFYEEIVEDKINVIVSILSHLRIDPGRYLQGIQTAADGTERLKRPEDARDELAFQARYAACMDYLRCHRQTLDVATFIADHVMPALRRNDPTAAPLDVPVIHLPIPGGRPMPMPAVPQSRLLGLRRTIYYCMRTIFEPRSPQSLETLRQQLASVVDLVPDELPIVLLRANLAVAARDFASAEHELRALVEVLGDDPLPYDALSDVLRRLDRIDEANALDGLRAKTFQSP